jgi:aldehyde dehydrogenase (NAD+)
MNIQEIPQIVARLRENFNAGKTRSLKHRRQQLDGIERFFKENKKEILEVLYQDLGKPSFEAFTTDYAFILAELNLIRRKLSSWMKPRCADTSLWAVPGKSYSYPEPFGVVLIIAPWNFPIQLSMVPLIGAIAAGNCVVLKPSEVTPATSAFMAKKLPQYVDQECLKIVEGDATVATALLAEKFDYIFYTGSGVVGRIVMAAAAKHLTPLTLELGGKSPCIVDKDVDLEKTARRIMLGKCYNAGQVCVAPDYMLVHESIEQNLLSNMKKILQEFYGDDPQKSPDYARIVDDKHFNRIMKLIPGSGEIYLGGNADEKDRYIAPTILRNVPIDSPIMSEEIFGPILPVIKVKNIDEAINFVNARPKPLALYIFSSDKKVQQKVLANTSSGNVAINYTSMQFITQLPSGGVGESGLGYYHGKATFETFTHHKAVLSKPWWPDPKFVFPPYTKLKLKVIMATFLKKLW